MTSSTDPTFLDLVRDVKEAVQYSQKLLEQGGITISRVDLKLKTILERIGGAKFKIRPIEISGQYAKTDIETINLSLIPKVPDIELMGSVDEPLYGAIEAINSAVQEAASSAPAFEFAEATVTLDVGITKEGTVAVVAGVKGKKVTTHTVTLTLTTRTKREG